MPPTLNLSVSWGPELDALVESGVLTIERDRTFRYIAKTETSKSKFVMVRGERLVTAWREVS